VAADEVRKMLAGVGRFIYPLVIVFVVGTTWCFAWARSVTDQSARGYWPAKDPDLMRRVLTMRKTVATADAADDRNPTIESPAD
jgi:hypothetical protein